MKKLALSVVLLMVAGAGVSAGGVGCSSSSSNGAADASSSSSGTDATGDDSSSSSGSSSGGGDDSSSSSGSSSGGTDSGSSSGACDDDGGIPYITADGGMNTVCEQCVCNNCKAAQTACTSDTSTLPVDDAGDVAPGCDLFVVCVEEDLGSILLGGFDGGPAAAVNTAISDCSGGDAGSIYSSGSIGLGTTLVGCVATSCTTECAP